jgi:hypothetical protein
MEVTYKLEYSVLAVPMTIDFLKFFSSNFQNPIIEKVIKTEYLLRANGHKYIFVEPIKNTKKEIGKRNLPLKQRNEILCRYQKIGQDKYKTLSDELNTIVFNELMPLALEKKLITEDDPVLWNDLYWMPLFFESELDIKKEESEKKWIFSLEIDLNLLQGAFKSYVLENKLDILSVKGRGPSLKNKVGLAAALLPYRDILNGRFYED